MFAPKVHHVHIEGFRRIQSALDLDLRTPSGAPTALAVLGGPNGSGKTSVLEAVLLGLGQEALLVRDLDAPDREGSWRAALPEGARIELTVSLDDGPEERWVRSRGSFSRVKPDGSREPLDNVFGSVHPSLLIEYFSSWRAPRLVGPVKPTALGRRPANNEANRLWRLKQRIADEHTRIGAQRSLRAFVPSFPETWMERLNSAWRRFHPDGATTLEAELVEPDGADGPFVDLIVKRGDQRICSVDQLSRGEIELLVFAQWVILNNVETGLLVIDEPELHLHPTWQAALLPALREMAPKLQILAATHAEAIWIQASDRFLLADADDPRPQVTPLDER